MGRNQFNVDGEAGRQEMTNDKDQLLAHLSHEFRNALSCIFQFGNILIGGLAGELSQEQRQYLGIMLQNASRIRSLLDGLLAGTPAALGECADSDDGSVPYGGKPMESTTIALELSVTKEK